MAAARSYITIDDMAQGTLSITLFGTADAVGHVQGNAGYAVTWKLYGNPSGWPSFAGAPFVDYRP